MSKILFLVNHDVVIYNFRLELVEALLSKGHEVFLSCPNRKKVDILKKMGVKFRNIKINRHGINPIREIGLINEYKKLLRSINPDIVFSYTIKPNIYGAMSCKKYNIPIVANITGLGTAVENSGIKQLITVKLYKYAFKNVKSTKSH